MKKINVFILGTMFLATGLITSCKKDDKDNKTGTTSSAKPNDQQGSSAADGAVSDVSDFINNKVGGGSNQRSTAYNLPCGVVSVDSTDSGLGYYTYHMKYGSQTACGYEKKSGQVNFERLTGSTYNAVGATIKLTYIDYVVTSLATGATVTLNGYITIKNVNGGYIWEVITAGSTINYQIRGNFSVKYSDGVVRSRNYYQMRTYSTTSAGDWKGLTLSIAGDTSVTSPSSLNGVSEIGKTYAGDYDYQTQILTPFTWSNAGTTYAGPYVLETAHARMNITIPAVSPAYVDVEGGYYWDYTNSASTPVLVNDLQANAYKITTVISTASVSIYQLY